MEAKLQGTPFDPPLAIFELRRNVEQERPFPCAILSLIVVLCQ